jgi:plasmid stabilization system protein ParE
VATFRVAEHPALEYVLQYLRGIEDTVIRAAAGEELRREFQRLADNPRLGTRGPTGPYEQFLTHQFRLGAGDKPRLAHVAFLRTDEGVQIADFSASPV